MAKRRRLTPPKDPVDWAARVRPDDAPARPLGTPPIASVAGDASAAAALAEVSGALTAARDEGRLIQRLALAEIDETHLVRDRLAFDDEAMDSLVESLRARGQQTPIEVVALGQGRYGLISGWRRITALKRLLDETGDDRFAHVLAILRRPEEASDSYVAMVEENEIRVGLSYYERARIVVRAVQEGVYPAQKPALQSLFAAASRAKRSKIKSFVALVEALDADLAFPTQIGERLGLALAKTLEETPGTAAAVAAALRADPGRRAEDEARILAAAAQARPAPPAPGPEVAETSPRPAPERPGLLRTGPLSIEARPGRVVLSGTGVDDAFIAALSDWLETRGTG